MTPTLRRWTTGLALGAGLAAAGLAGAAAVKGRVAAGVAFTETFATFDPARWYVSDGWGNGEFAGADWRRGQVSHTPGALALVLVKNPASKYGYSSGEIQTQDFYQYGYFETSMRAARGVGVITGFFTYAGEVHGEPWNEVDVEILGRNTRQVQLTYHTDGNHPKPVVVDLPFDSAEGFHRYGFEWRKDVIRWYVDGRMVQETRRTAKAFPDRPQKIYLDLWNAKGLDDWAGRFAWQGNPIRAEFRCVAYRPAYPGEPVCPSG